MLSPEDMREMERLLLLGAVLHEQWADHHDALVGHSGDPVTLEFLDINQEFSWVERHAAVLFRPKRA